MKRTTSHSIFLTLLLVLCTSIAGQSQTILVPPYLQPGNAATLNKESKVILWETDSLEGTFQVRYSTASGKKKVMTAKISKTNLSLAGKRTWIYRAVLPNLRFDEAYTYTVSLQNKIIAQATFTSRSKKQQTHFAVIGDFGAGTPEQLSIAKLLEQHKPDFVLTTGDNAYQDGRTSEYRKNLFPYYLPMHVDSSMKLMQTTPFYMLMGNHDIHSRDLSKFPDGLAYFYYNDLPLNAPPTTLTLPVYGDENQVATFKKVTKGKYPNMLNYSFDYGNVHITCLDANLYINPVDPVLLQWLSEDIGKSKAEWKIVTYHHPPFNSSIAHYTDQHMRLLAPFLEEWKVDLVVNGHVHNYQRTVPLRFKPQINEAGDRYVVGPEGEINGTFALDTLYDGQKDTTPEGIIYIVTGASGAPLYDRKISNQPERWKHEPKENWVPFTVKLISDRHSFTLIDTKSKTLVLRQIDGTGQVIDTITITKN